MNWYIAKIVFNIISGEGKHKPQFDEQYRLVKGSTYEEAFTKALAIGSYEEEILINAQSHLLKWEFVNVSELFQIDELRDGMELFSTTQEADERKLYIETIHMKAAYIKSKFDFVAAEA